MPRGVFERKPKEPSDKELMTALMKAADQGRQVASGILSGGVKVEGLQPAPSDAEIAAEHAKAAADVSDETKAAVEAMLAPQTPTLANRGVYRIMLHNGVHLGLPPNARVERMIMHKDAPWAKPMGRPVAELMTLTPAGVHVRFPGEIEKLIPYANIYEADLAP